MMRTDTLIIGCGIAGAAAALRLSENPNHQITILTRAPQATDSNTAWAQGGIVTRGIGDSPELLVNDIIHAGDGLSSRKAAHILATEGPKLVQSILVDRCGVRFDKDSDGLPFYGLEAAHSVRRIVHVSDKTGWSIANDLLATIAQYPNITLLTSHTAVDLLVGDGHCVGATVLDNEVGEIQPIYAANTMLATGGLGQIFLNTTNPAGARGDGMAMAKRAGARLANLEYVQFHPTALYTSGVTKPLVSEAVRGEGAILLTPDGRRFMSDYAPDQIELAPRDVVARAIHSEMMKGNHDYMLLDIASQRPAQFIREHFPALMENAASIGLDATVDPVPVVPAAHYSCGGVAVDEWGSTTVSNLYAIGEVSSTGLHGANRLASTSLLEGLVWGDRAARHIAQQEQQAAPKHKSPKTISGLPVLASELTLYWQRLQQTMWRNVGIVRTQAGLQRAELDLRQLAIEVEQLYSDARPTDALVGLRNAVQVGQHVTRAALANPHSRGAHFRADKQPKSQPVSTVLSEGIYS
jgi:L-aspartate oxidase